MNKEIKEIELKMLIKQAKSLLPMLDKPVTKKGQVGMEKMKIRANGQNQYCLHLLLVDDSETIHIIKDQRGDPPVLGAKIVDGVVVEVVGFGEFKEPVAMMYSAYALLVGFLDCTQDMFVEEVPSAPFEML